MTCATGGAMATVDVSAAATGDFLRLAALFSTWPKPAALFDGYRDRQDAGEIDVLVVRVDGEPAGYCLVEWLSTYPPFADAGIPEIADLNVVARRRGVGAGSRLLQAAEERIAGRSVTAGLRVGLYADYGAAQRMYVRRGYVPDGRGVTVGGRVVEPGATVVLDDDAVLAFTRALR